MSGTALPQRRGDASSFVVMLANRIYGPLSGYRLGSWNADAASIIQHGPFRLDLGTSEMEFLAPCLLAIRVCGAPIGRPRCIRSQAICSIDLLMCTAEPSHPAHTVRLWPEPALNLQRSSTACDGGRWVRCWQMIDERVINNLVVHDPAFIKSRPVHFDSVLDMEITPF